MEDLIPIGRQDGGALIGDVRYSILDNNQRLRLLYCFSERETYNSPGKHPGCREVPKIKFPKEESYNSPG